MLSTTQKMQQRESELYQMQMTTRKETGTGNVLVSFKGEPVGCYPSFEQANKLAPQAIKEMQAGHEPEPRLIGTERNVQRLKQAKRKSSKPGNYKTRKGDIRTTDMGNGRGFDNVRIR